MDSLYKMGAVMQFFDHLFDSSEVTIGEALLAHVQSKASVWYANTNQIASFWRERLRAYEGMSVVNAVGETDVTLGPTADSGLTLVIGSRGNAQSA